MWPRLHHSLAILGNFRVSVDNEGMQCGWCCVRHLCNGMKNGAEHVMLCSKAHDLIFCELVLYEGFCSYRVEVLGVGMNPVVDWMDVVMACLMYRFVDESSAHAWFPGLWQGKKPYDWLV